MGRNKPFLFFIFSLFIFFTFSVPVFAQGEDVGLEGDRIEYSRGKELMIARGNVVITKGDTKLICDYVEFSRQTNLANAKGNVRLIMPQGEISGEEMEFNFKTMRGEFHGATMASTPYYGTGVTISKVSEKQMDINNGFITTCDHDKPHYGMKSKKMEIYPGEKLVARNIRMFIGKVPLIFLPRFTQKLTSKEPKVIFTPGYDKEWGMFMLSQWRYELHKNFKGWIHVDAREKKDIAWGVDSTYKIPGKGEGSFRTYYMKERSIDATRFFKERNSPTIERERFRVQWRHKWKVDKKTTAIMQYYKLSDNTLLKDYFRNENRENLSPNTFFLLTKSLAVGTFSFRTDIRVNHFESMVERLPEIRYDLANKEILDTGIFFRNSTIYSNLTKKSAAPSEARTKTMRLNTDNELSYPMKVAFVEARPFIGTKQTYYSRAKQKDQYSSIRGIFRTGINLSTKVFRIFDIQTNVFGLDINRLRHIITPSISYLYQGNPTVPSSQLDSFDGIDSLTNEHSITFSLENKLQTKRNKKVVDLARFILSSPFYLKESSSKGGFGAIKVDIDLKPMDGLTFYFDSSYDTHRSRLNTANFDMYINGGSKWSANIGKRWNREVDDQITTELSYKVNPKWALRTYTRFDLRNGILKEQEFTVRRDLHAWWMDINFNETRQKGNEIWIVFTLKAFPDMTLDVGSSFNKRKAGSQSSGGN